MAVAIETSVGGSTATSPVDIALTITSAVKALVLLHSQVDDTNGADCTAMWNTDEAFTELLDFETTWGRADVYIMYLNNPTAGNFNVTVTRLGARGYAYIWALTDCGYFPAAMVDSGTAEVNPNTIVNVDGLTAKAGEMALGGGAAYQGTVANAPVGGCVEDADTPTIDGYFWAGHELAGDNIGFSNAESKNRSCAAIVVAEPVLAGGPKWFF